jgi:hypothetical protein
VGPPSFAQLIFSRHNFFLVFWKKEIFLFFEQQQIWREKNLLCKRRLFDLFVVLGLSV